MPILRTVVVLAVLAQLIACAPRPRLVVLEYGSNVSDSVWASEACQRSVAVLAAGDSAATKFLRLYVGSCQPAGNALLARTIGDNRRTTDTALLDAVTSRTIEVLDSAVFESVYDIASDSSASEVARIYAWRSLAYAVRPGRFRSVTDMAAPERTCPELSPGSHWRLTLGGPLPADHRDRIRQLSTAVQADESAPDAVRHAAHCTERAALRGIRW